MPNSITKPENSVNFSYDGSKVEIRSVDKDDHILGVMKKTDSFYEKDVLEFIRSEFEGLTDKGVAIDIGTFIGTHSIYFAKFIGFNRVFSFEANPSTYSIFLDNIKKNSLENIITPENKALGSVIGYVRLDTADQNNMGSMSVVYSDNKSDIAVSTVDLEMQHKRVEDIRFIKIDVEGFELEVLKGAKKTIEKHKPLICIEAHTTNHLVSVISMLKGNKYSILHCLGSSPTYILKSVDSNPIFRYSNYLIWIAWSLAPYRFRKKFRRYLQKAGKE